VKREVIVSGFGGQGVMSIGKFLVEAGLLEGLEVCWVPSYGPEMRGGTANCSVILSTEMIGSPVVSQPTELIVMNSPSLRKFEQTVVPGGIILLDCNEVEAKVTRTDVKVIDVPCESIARELGAPKVSNMVLLGAYLEATGALKVETVRGMLEHKFAGKKAKYIPINFQALERGMACVHK